jgi:hypothetical protein
MDELIVKIKVKCTKVNHPDAKTQHTMVKDLAKALTPLIGETLTGDIKPPEFKIESHHINS